MLMNILYCNASYLSSQRSGDLTLMVYRELYSVYMGAMHTGNTVNMSLLFTSDAPLFGSDPYHFNALSINWTIDPNICIS